MSCPTELTLAMYVDGELSITDTRAVDLHVAGCASCRHAVSALRAETRILAAALAHEPEPVAIPAFRTPTFWLPLAATAAVITLAAALVDSGRRLVGSSVPAPLTWFNPFDTGSVVDLVFSFGLFLLQRGGDLMTLFAETAVLAVVVAFVAWVLIGLRGRGPGPLLLMSLVGVAVMLPMPSQALEIRRVDDGTVLVPEGEVIEDTLIALGETVEIDGDVKGDLIAFGRRVVLRGRVGGLVLTGAQTVTVQGDVGGSLIGFGETLDVSASRVGGNLFGFGNTVEVDQAANILANALLFGQRATVTGPVGGDVLGFGETLEIGSNIGGGLTAYAHRLTLLAPARIAGDVAAHLSDEDNLSISPAAEIGGELTTEFRMPREERNDYLTGGFYLAQLLRFAAAFVTGVILLALVPGLRRLSIGSPGNALVAGGVGLVALVAVPVIAVIVAVTIIGIPVSLLGLLLWLAGIYLAKVVLAHVVGVRVFQGSETPRHFAVSLALGLLLVILAINLPLIGGVINFLLTICGLGLLVLFLWRALPGRHHSAA